MLSPQWMERFDGGGRYKSLLCVLCGVLQLEHSRWEAVCDKKSQHITSTASHSAAVWHNLQITFGFWVQFLDNVATMTWNPTTDFISGHYLKHMNNWPQLLPNMDEREEQDRREITCAEVHYLAVILTIIKTEDGVCGSYCSYMSIGWGLLLDTFLLSLTAPAPVLAVLPAAHWPWWTGWWVTIHLWWGWTSTPEPAASSPGGQETDVNTGNKTTRLLKRSGTYQLN